MIKLSLAKSPPVEIFDLGEIIGAFCSCYTQATTNLHFTPRVDLYQPRKLHAASAAMAPFVGPNELLQRLEKLEKLVEDGETKKFRIVTADAIIVIVLIIVFVMTIE